MIFFNVEFDKNTFYDLPPVSKSTEEIAYLLLKDVSGDYADMSKYNEREIHRCARKLILNGFIHGTVIDFDHCSWSRITMRGEHLKDYIESATMMR